MFYGFVDSYHSKRACTLVIFLLAPYFTHYIKLKKKLHHFYCLKNVSLELELFIYCKI